MLTALSSCLKRKALESFEKYCNIWKLKVNTGKTKVVVFSKGKMKNCNAFKINDQKWTSIHTCT